MSSGRFGKADLAAAADTTLFAGVAGEVATATVAFCNRSASTVNVRLAVRKTAEALADSDFLEYDASIPPNGVLERSQVVVASDETVVVRASAVGVSVRAHGFSEAQ